MIGSAIEEKCAACETVDQEGRMVASIRINCSKLRQAVCNQAQRLSYRHVVKVEVQGPHPGVSDLPARELCDCALRSATWRSEESLHCAPESLRRISTWISARDINAPRLIRCRRR